MMNPLYSSWNNALDYSRYPRGNPRDNTAPTVLQQMHYHYRGSTVHLVPSPRYYREILPMPTAITAVLPHSPLPCHSLTLTISWTLAVEGLRNDRFTNRYSGRRADARPDSRISGPSWITNIDVHRQLSYHWMLKLDRRQSVNLLLQRHGNSSSRSTCQPLTAISKLVRMITASAADGVRRGHIVPTIHNVNMVNKQ